MEWHPIYYSSDYQLAADYKYSFDDPTMKAMRDRNPNEVFDSQEVNGQTESVNPREYHPELQLPTNKPTNSKEGFQATTSNNYGCRKWILLFLLLFLIYINM